MNEKMEFRFVKLTILTGLYAFNSKNCYFYIETEWFTE